MRSPSLVFTPFLLLFVTHSLAGPSSKSDDATKAVQEKARLLQVEASAMSLECALKIYKLNAGQYPTEKQGFKALVEKPADPPTPREWVKVVDKVPLDPWQREYRLVVRKKADKEIHLIVSQGPDPKSPADDIEYLVDQPVSSK